MGGVKEVVKSVKNEKLLRAKKTLKVGTMNVRTVRKAGRLDELVFNFEQYGLSILGIQEHRLEHCEDLSYQSIGKSTFITSSCTRNAGNSKVGGVGILLSRASYKSLSSIERVSERIMVATFDGNPRTTVVVVYSPTNVSDQENIDTFYNSLDALMSTIPPHNVCLLIGDLNARVKGQWSYHNATNRNGEKLEELVEEKKLWVAGTKFRKKKGKLWTYRGPNGYTSQIDHIIINKKWKNSVVNSEVYSTFSSVGSDHRVVVADIKLSLRKPKMAPRKVKHDWNCLRYDKDLAARYSIEVSNRFTALQCTEDDPTVQYQHFIVANNETAEQLLPKLKKPVRKDEFTNHPMVVLARKRLNEASKRYCVMVTKVNQQEVEIAKRNLDEAHDAARAEKLDEQVDCIKKDHTFGKFRKVWKLVHEVTGKNKAYAGKIDGDTEEERVKTWQNQFQNLLGKPPEVSKKLKDLPKINPTEIDDYEFTTDEYREVVNSLVEGKNGGADGVRPEVLKRSGSELDGVILEMCNRALNNGITPAQWSEINIVPVPKSGPLNKVANYRGISMCPMITKVLNKMILMRIRPSIEPILRNSQNGFRPGRGTVPHILALRRILEGIRDRKLPATIIFIDFKKAFDSIDRDNMFEILKAYGVPPNLLQLIISIYEQTMARVTSPDGDTVLFKILAGIMQGDTLAPYLFIIVLDFALRTALDGKEDLGFTLRTRRSRRHPAITLSDLGYADDLAALADCVADAQTILAEIEKAAAQVGLYINTKKTNCMSFNQDNVVDVVGSDGEVVKSVDDYKYLGAWISSSKKDFNTRRARAWDIAHKLKPLWTSNMPRKTKVGVLTAAVESVLMYGSESWTLTKALTNRLDGLYTRLLRFALNVDWSDHVTNVVLYAGLPKLSNKLRERRLGIAGHCVRHVEEAAHHTILWEPTHGDSRRGAPYMNYVTLLKQDTGYDNTHEIRTAMLCRDTWSGVTRGSRASTG